MPAQSLGEYAESLLGREDPLLAQISAEAEDLGLPMIQVPGELARLLGILVRASGARSALEFGTLFGLSGITIARALPADGRLTTLEYSPKHAEVAARNFERAGLANKVDIVQGDARDSLRTLTGRSFDFVFIDADKPGYPTYLDAALELSHPGTVIVADNVWRRGEVLEGSDDASAAMAQFNRTVAENQRLLTTFFSTRDGADAATMSVVLE